MTQTIFWLMVTHISIIQTCMCIFVIVKIRPKNIALKTITIIIGIISLSFTIGHTYILMDLLRTVSNGG